LICHSGAGASSPPEQAGAAAKLRVLRFAPAVRVFMVFAEPRALWPHLTIVETEQAKNVETGNARGSRTSGQRGNGEKILSCEAGRYPYRD
jgi:hypothetical protein